MLFRSFRIAPLFVGKLSTVLQALYVGGHLASAAFGFSLRALSPWDAYVFAAVTLGSALAYAGVGVRALHGLSLRVDAGA